jgi:hypothetical protein
MKKVLLIFLVVCSVFLFSGFLIGDKEHDKQLVGVWKGFEKDKQIEGVEKHWILQRYENGKYVIMFTIKQDCEVETFQESGSWWTKDGKFYETNGENKDIDVYQYEVKDKIVVDFKSIELNGEKRTDYHFSDYKIDLD